MSKFCAKDKVIYTPIHYGEVSDESFSAVILGGPNRIYDNKDWESINLWTIRVLEGKSAGYSTVITERELKFSSNQYRKYCANCDEDAALWYTDDYMCAFCRDAI